MARQARAAQDALKRNDYAAAVNYAQQAANSAPQNAELWFLLGYAARLNEKYQLSVDALQPRSETSTEFGPRAWRDWRRPTQRWAAIRKQNSFCSSVVEANPKDANSLQLAGELMLNTDPKAALSSAPASRRDTTFRTYRSADRPRLRTLGQPEEFDRYLNRAKSRAPRDPEVLRAVAGQYRDQGKYDEAIATLQAIPTKTADVQAELAYTYGLAGKTTGSGQLVFATGEVLRREIWTGSERRASLDQFGPRR